MKTFFNSELGKFGYVLGMRKDAPVDGRGVFDVVYLDEPQALIPIATLTGIGFLEGEVTAKGTVSRVHGEDMIFDTYLDFRECDELMEDWENEVEWEGWEDV